jgi:hypothetical protein
LAQEQCVVSWTSLNMCMETAMLTPEKPQRGTLPVHPRRDREVS